MQRVGITRVANITGLDTVGVPVWQAVRPLGRSLSVSQGKGTTHDLARISAIMESIESFHAENLELETIELPLGQARDRLGYANVATLQYRRNRALKSSVPLGWVLGLDLVSGNPTHVPREMIDMDFSQSRKPSSRFFISSTTGLAAGNSVQEAQIHGLCEAVERDQKAFWQKTRELSKSARATRIELSSISSPGNTQLLNRIQSAGLEVAIWSMSTTIAIPCFACTVWDSVGGLFFLQKASGYGCHPRKEIALSRSITEALQSRLAQIAGSRDDIASRDYRNQLNMKSPENQVWLAGVADETESIPLTELPEFAIPKSEKIFDTEAMLKWLIEQVVNDGISEIISVDLTLKKLGIPVIRIIAPGMEDKPGIEDFLAGKRLEKYCKRLIEGSIVR